MLHTKIFIGMLFGIVAGLVVKNLGLSAETLSAIVSWVAPVGERVMNLIFMMVLPLILSALDFCIAEIGHVRQLARTGGELLVYTVIVSSVAILIVITMVNIFNPGDAVSPETREYLLTEFGAEAAAAEAQAAAIKGDERTVGDILAQIIPRNPIEEMANAFN